ncbi:hypothetical protein [Clostridium botulinum]|uniref:hypothetical protein n=1 Tax=Clostridium botulinum TaxID=1491 RepID=UPI001A9259FB|nr:hypothetical protein [Clostridium botulinum]
MSFIKIFKFTKNKGLKLTNKDDAYAYIDIKVKFFSNINNYLNKDKNSNLLPINFRYV